jgi:DNA-binding response OmpR family regulator
MVQKGKILLAEDDANLGFVIKDNLEIAGYGVELYTDGETALTAFGRGEFDMCILDVMMPKRDGFSVAQTIRQTNQDVPIIFLTAKSMKEDKLKGFQLGADDYITKPFSIEELILRVEAILKRSRKEGRPSQANESFLLGKFVFDFKNQLIKYQNQTQNLTQREAELLRLLCMNKNQIVERDTILNLIWGDDSYFTGRSLDVFISRLRKYLKPDPNIEISNIHSVGFKLIEKE